MGGSLGPSDCGDGDGHEGETVRMACSSTGKVYGIIGV